MDRKTSKPAAKMTYVHSVNVQNMLCYCWFLCRENAIKTPVSNVSLRCCVS